MQDNCGAKAQHITLHRSAGVFSGSFHGPPPRDGSNQNDYAKIDALGGLLESALFETTLRKVQSEPIGGWKGTKKRGRGCKMTPKSHKQRGPGISWGPSKGPGQAEGPKKVASASP